MTPEAPIVLREEDTKDAESESIRTEVIDNLDQKELKKLAKKTTDSNLSDDSSLDLTPPDFDLNDEQIKDIEHLKKMQKSGDEDILELGKLDNGLHESSSKNSSSRSKNVEMESEHSLRSGLLTDQMVQDMGKDSLLEPPRTKIDYVKDKNKLNFSSAHDILQVRDGIHEAQKPKTAEKEENIKDLEAKAFQEKADDEIQEGSRFDESVSIANDGKTTHQNENEIPSDLKNEKSKVNPLTQGEDTDIVENYDIRDDEKAMKMLSTVTNVDDFKKDLTKIEADIEKEKKKEGFESQTKMLEKKKIKQLEPKDDFFQYKYDSMDEKYAAEQRAKEKRKKKEAGEDLDDESANQLQIEGLEEVDKSVIHGEGDHHSKDEQVQQKITEDQTIIDENEGQESKAKVTKDETIVDDQEGQDSKAKVTKDETIVDDQEGQVDETKEGEGESKGVEESGEGHDQRDASVYLGDCLVMFATLMIVLIGLK